ncbi:hypothetical protein GQ42DRAFT_14477 [Ramicandelaber brevisporus]|nr:hypothetical protein GQ42DRAFT_14477 [Ramicandelaber brevisporus]
MHSQCELSAAHRHIHTHAHIHAHTYRMTLWEKRWLAGTFCTSTHSDRPRTGSWSLQLRRRMLLPIEQNALPTWISRRWHIFCSLLGSTWLALAILSKLKSAQLARVACVPALQLPAQQARASAFKKAIGNNQKVWRSRVSIPVPLAC